ncbi:unnamed protein product [Boreogadus saida]
MKKEKSDEERCGSTLAAGHWVFDPPPDLPEDCGIVGNGIAFTAKSICRLRSDCVRMPNRTATVGCPDGKRAEGKTPGNPLTGTHNT